MLELTKKIPHIQGQMEAAMRWYNHDKIKSHTRWVGDLQTGERYQRSFPTAVKVQNPMSGFPAWGTNGGTRSPQGM